MTVDVVSSSSVLVKVALSVIDLFSCAVVSVIGSESVVGSFWLSVVFVLSLIVEVSF